MEAVITEDENAIRGSCRRRHQVAGNPDVLFEFEGQRQGDAASVRWTHSDGARGEVQLKLESDDALEFTWSATDSGTGMRLSSGTATLVRRGE
jgi:uncharacterized protein YndB with AHSA1/START domain